MSHDTSSAARPGRSDTSGDETPRDGFAPLGVDGLRSEGEVHRLRALAAEAEQLAGLPGAADESLPDRLERALLAIRRQRQEQDEQQERLELTVGALRAASRVAQSVSSSFRREKVLAAIPDALVRIFGAVTARVWMVGPGDRCGTCAQASRCADKTECLHLVDLGDRGPLDLALARVPIGPYSVGRLGQLRRVISTNDIASEPGLADPDWARVERVRSFAGHPLEHEGALLGAVAMWSRSPVRPEMLEALAIIAQHASTAIAFAQLVETARAESERREVAVARLSAILDAGVNGCVLFGNDDRILYSNESFRRIFNLDRRSLVGVSRAALIELLEQKIVASADRALAAWLTRPGDAKPSFAGEMQIRDPGSPAPRFVHGYHGPVRSHAGESFGWMAACADVTQGREIDRVKNEFISAVSHELRTPLTSIKGALALLLDGTTPFDPETAELLRISQRNAERLVRLVADILDIHKLEADKIEMRLADCAPEELCRMALAELASIASRDDVQLHVEAAPGLPRVHTDADRVLQILSNLLSNAFKFSPPRGRVLLRALPADGSVRFEVQDSGPGVSLEFRGKLFTKFAQSERTQQEQSGTGLGLAICEALVGKLGGQIGCDSVPGAGATFFFTLPVLEPGSTEAR